MGEYLPEEAVSSLGPWFPSNVLAHKRQSGNNYWVVIPMVANEGAEDLARGHGFLYPELPPFATLSGSTWITFFFFWSFKSWLKWCFLCEALPVFSLAGSSEEHSLDLS